MGAERDWWRRALGGLARPREVFEALRDDTDGAAAARQEPILLLMFAAGLAAALGAERALFEDVGGVDYAVLAFLTGGTYALTLYWVGGWALGFAVRRLSEHGGGRHTRHLLAYALAPLGLGLFGWLVYEPLLLAFAAWSLGLIVTGLCVVYDWTVRRAAAASLLALLLVGVLWSALRVLE
ncbi:MAG: YIP1 family protein [Actinobacteria bacterium]|nr:YIP1 family protein [Actinomycetota bacterium]